MRIRRFRQGREVERGPGGALPPRLAAAKQQDAAQQGRERADYGKADQDRMMRVLPRLEIHDMLSAGEIVDVPSRRMHRDQVTGIMVAMDRGGSGMALCP